MTDPPSRSSLHRSTPSRSTLSRWSWVVVLVVGLLLFEAVRRALVATGNPNLVPSLILLGAAVVPTAFVTFIAQRRLPYSVDLGWIAGVALVGGVVGVVTAGVLEFDTLRKLGALPMLGVGLIEESAKLVAPLAVVLVTRHRRPADGLLLGVASGAGFAAMETMGYGFVTLIKSRGDVLDTLDVLVLRGLMSPAGHMAWTGITAAALFALVGSARRRHPLARFLLAFALSVVLHAVWDGVGGLVVYVVLAVLGLGALTLTAHRIAASTPRNAHGEARSEPEPDRDGVPSGRWRA